METEKLMACPICEKNLVPEKDWQNIRSVPCKTKGGLTLSFFQGDWRKPSLDNPLVYVAACEMCRAAYKPEKKN